MHAVLQLVINTSTEPDGTCWAGRQAGQQQPPPNQQHNQLLSSQQDSFSNQWVDH